MSLVKRHLYELFEEESEFYHEDMTFHRWIKRWSRIDIAFVEEVLLKNLVKYEGVQYLFCADVGIKNEVLYDLCLCMPDFDKEYKVLLKEVKLYFRDLSIGNSEARASLLKRVKNDPNQLKEEMIEVYRKVGGKRTALQKHFGVGYLYLQRIINDLDMSSEFQLLAFEAQKEGWYYNSKIELPKILKTHKEINFHKN